MTFENILMEVKDQVAWITVNRPQVLNALNHKTMDELGEAFDRAGSDDGVRALILTGAGEKSFVAGADINEHTGDLGYRDEGERVDKVTSFSLSSIPFTKLY